MTDMPESPYKTRLSPRGKVLRAEVACSRDPRKPGSSAHRKRLTCTSCGCAIPPETPEGSYQLFWSDGSGMCSQCVQYFLKDSPGPYAK
jgi:hypothetical protein